MAHHFKYFIYEKKTNQLKNLRKKITTGRIHQKHLVLKSLVETDP